MKLIVRGIPTERAERIRAGGPDANGQPALLRAVSGQLNPCRHCLQRIPEVEPKLVLSYRPFDAPQPFAETGPIFLHEHGCPHYEGNELPDWFALVQPALVRGYGHDDWIRYETGAVVPGEELAAACRRILENPEVAYVHIRSRFNCFLCRVERG